MNNNNVIILCVYKNMTCVHGMRELYRGYIPHLYFWIQSAENGTKLPTGPWIYLTNNFLNSFT